MLAGVRPGSGIRPIARVLLRQPARTPREAGARPIRNAPYRAMKEASPRPRPGDTGLAAGPGPGMGKGGATPFMRGRGGRLLFVQTATTRRLRSAPTIMPPGACRLTAPRFATGVSGANAGPTRSDSDAPSARRIQDRTARGLHGLRERSERNQGARHPRARDPLRAPPDTLPASGGQAPPGAAAQTGTLGVRPPPDVEPGHGGSPSLPLRDGPTGRHRGKGGAGPPPLFCSTVASHRRPAADA